jgi:hypothetical protein
MATATTKLDGDVYVTGHLQARTLKIPAGTVTDAAVGEDAAIAATKIQKPRLLTYSRDGTAASATVPLYECRGATATVVDVRVGSVGVAVGAATVTVDIKKNGTTILSGVVTLDNGNVARVSEPGTVALDDLVTGDWLDVVVTATAGGGTLPTGLLVQVEIFEDQ